MATFLFDKYIQVAIGGAAASGAKLYFYQAGTTTKISIYQDAAAGTPHANPVVADTDGHFAGIYIPTTNTTYKYVLTRSDGTTVVDSQDNVPAPAYQPLDADLTTLSTAFTSASASGPASLALAEDTDNGTNKGLLTAPSSIASDRTWTFPDKSGTVAMTSDAVSVIGKHTIWVPAAAMSPATTNGAASGTTETSTNKVMLITKDFDASTEEFVQFEVQMPKSWDEGTITAKFDWFHGSTTTNFGVCWGLEAISYSDGTAGDTAWGTEVDTTDTGGTTNTVYLSTESAAVTVGNTPGADELVKFRITRVVGNAGDTMAVDAKLLGVRLLFTIDAGTDD